MISRCQFLYLHGFASSPSSSKATFFAEKLKSQNATVSTPDLNQPGFENFSLTSQLKIVDAELRCVKQANPKSSAIVLIGSSMGGLLATMKSASTNDIKALILLAPGFGLMQRWPALFGEKTLNDWKEKGSLEVYHHGYGKYLPLSYSFIEDAAKYQTSDLKVNVPTLVFHGRSDSTVPILESENFERNNSAHVVLESLEDDHQLLKSLDTIWHRAEEFISSLQLN